MCNCKKASTIIEKYGENVVKKSDTIIYFSKFVDKIFVGTIMIVGFPIMLSYWLIMNLIGKKAIIRLPRSMEKGIKLAVERNGKTI